MVCELDRGERDRLENRRFPLITVEHTATGVAWFIKHAKMLIVTDANDDDISGKSNGT